MASRTKKKKPTTADFATNQFGDVQSIRDAINEHFKAEVSPEITDREFSVQPSGILSMDLAIGNGGILGGRVMDIYGWEQTGKTLVCLTIAGYIQRCQKYDVKGDLVNKIVAFLDAEGTFSKNFAESAGVNTDELILIENTVKKPLSGEDFFNAIVLCLRMGVDYIIVDSCPALVPEQIIINELGGSGQKASLSQLMAQGLQKVTPLVSSTGQSMIHFINQKRNKPMAKPWEKNDPETGGNALKFYSTYRFEVVESVDIIKAVLGQDGKYRSKR